MVKIYIYMKENEAKKDQGKTEAPTMAVRPAVKQPEEKYLEKHR